MFCGLRETLAVTVRVCGAGLTGRVIGLVGNPWVVDCVKSEDLRMVAVRETMVCVSERLLAECEEEDW